MIKDKDYQRFYGSEGLWRNDNNAERNKYDNQPTISTVITHAQDIIANGKYYGFGVKHVRGFHGKGFMPFFWFLLSPGASGGNGELFYGTDKETYDKAVKNGKLIVNKHDADMDESLDYGIKNDN